MNAFIRTTSGHGFLFNTDGTEESSVELCRRLDRWLEHPTYKFEKEHADEVFEQVNRDTRNLSDLKKLLKGR